VSSGAGGLAIAAGSDLVYVPAFRHVLRPAFVARAFTAAEVAAAQDRHDPAVFYASRWAAKEAAYKALCDLAIRSGRSTDGLACFRDYEVVRRPGSRVPALQLYGEPRRLLEELHDEGDVSIGLSLTDEHDYAGAFVTIAAIARLRAHAGA
jgi:holo-[acyl-carrier protein] synthase